MSHYNLVQTKKGFVSVKDITEGTEVYCYGEWKKAPAPIQAQVIKCDFDVLPSTCFQPQFIQSDTVSICHNFIYNNLIQAKPCMSILGYYNQRRQGKQRTWLFTNWDSVCYWYPRFCQLFDNTVTIDFQKVNKYFSLQFRKDCNIPVLQHSNDFAKRNLQYIVEGILLDGFHVSTSGREILIKSDLNQTMKLALHLLGINAAAYANSVYPKYHKVTNSIKVINYKALLENILDDTNKKVIPSELIPSLLIKSIDLPEYTIGNLITNKTETTEWILPGLNYDVNGISTINSGTDGLLYAHKTVHKDKRTPTGAIVKSKSYLYDNVFEKILANNGRTLDEFQ